MLTEIMQYADPENYPSALNVPRNAAAPSPDISRTLPPTIGAEAPAAGSTTDDSSEIRAAHRHLHCTPQPRQPCRTRLLPRRTGLYLPYSFIQWSGLRKAALVE